MHIFSKINFAELVNTNLTQRSTFSNPGEYKIEGDFLKINILNMKYLFPVLVLLLAGFFSFSGFLDKGTLRDSRDGNTYEYVEVNQLKWLIENLRLKTETSMCVSDSLQDLCQECGEFYFVDEVFNICPENWRLPTEKEVKALIKLEKRRKISLREVLALKLCGRVDNKQVGKIGEQTTYWIDAELSEGNITHWHVFGQAQELHNHNVVQAKRQFPVRCVCEVETGN